MEGITLKSLLVIPAMSGFFYHDVLSLVSVTGCSLMFLSEFFDTARFGAPLRRLGELGEWSTAPLVFGTLFQLAVIMLGLTDQNIGFIVPMAPNLVNGLFAVSFLLLAGRWWLKRSGNTNG